MEQLIHFLEYMGEGMTGTLILLLLPALIIFLDKERNSEKKHHFSVLLENHFLDRVIELATRKRGDGS